RLSLAVTVRLRERRKSRSHGEGVFSGQGSLSVHMSSMGFFSHRADLCCALETCSLYCTTLCRNTHIHICILYMNCSNHMCLSLLALHEFPTDLFTHKERTEGAVALHVLCTIYMFCALALVCDDYFVPSLEKLCERLQLSEDVAGATFMAAGSSAPELFTSIIGVFITKGDVGVGTIVGSAVFNILCIIGVCGFFAGQAVKLSHWALLRDSIYYTFSITALIVSLILILMYAVYILIMKFNGRAHRYFDRRKKSSVNLSNGLTGSTDLEDNITCDATAVLLKKANFHCKPSVLMVDELLSAYPHQLSFSEAGMRIMITSHFSPRTRLTMASRMHSIRRLYTFFLANTVPRYTGHLSRPEFKAVSCVDPRMATRVLGYTEYQNEWRLGHVQSWKKCLLLVQCITEAIMLSAIFVLLPPAGACNKLKWLVMWPLSLLLFLTVPNCAKRRWERWFMVSFFTATMWIAGLSYIMVWMVTVIGFTLGIPDVIMGITFLAAGTSVPDCMASVIVARQGLGDMAISNSIGSNVFDILVGLGLPWTLQTLCIDYGSNIYLNSRGLIFSVGLLLASVFVTVLGVHLNKWTLDRRLGLACLVLYAIFLCFSILIEFNVFIFVNLPMCRDIH
uniref:Solute carrier family 24 member 3 n=1 Tax=Sander lucioperca TaxID=283035 RepID=A0A8C9Z3E6_SANLU